MMYKGGANYTTQSARTIRIAGLITPIFLVIYGLLIQVGIISSAHYSGDVAFFSISFWFIVLSIIQYLFPSKNARDSALRLIGYHLLAAMFLLFIAGVSTPFVVCWILLMLASNIYFSKIGLIWSTTAFVLVVAFDTFLQLESATAIAYNITTLAATLLVGTTILIVSRHQSVDRLALSRSKAQELLQRDRTLAIVNNLADAILSTDKRGIVRVYNASSLNLLDTNDKLNGRHIDDIVPLVDQTGQTQSLFELLQKSHSVAVRDDLNYMFEDGEHIRLEVTYSPVRRGYNSSKQTEMDDGYIVIMRDITKSKSLEEERDEFISVVSHELRTPITIVEGTISNVQLMIKRSDIAKGKLEDAITMAHDQVVFLARMVNDLSTLSRAERGTADATEDIDVQELAHKLFNEYTPQASAKGLRLDLDITTRVSHVTASRLYLEELLQNFITNAIKYTKTGTITLKVTQKEGVITFSVKDSGIGISKSDQAKVFDKFYRSEDYRTRETGGTGLGLYVAAKLAHKLVTHIQLTSRLNHGSTFWFELPQSNHKKH